ncbi:MAG: VWA domain-containing protein [Candidatus Wallbacteria bacterium]|nr:VWA domain-containing protein [Candidatus Wallbacteria bacterium]
MQRWKVPAILAGAVAAVVVGLGPWIRSPFATVTRPEPPPRPPIVTPHTVAPVTSLGGITMEVLPSQSATGAGQDSDLFVAVRLTARSMPSVARPPLNLALVLDKSGSMTSERKIDYLRKAARQLVETLSPSDVLSIVVYDSEVELLSAASPVQDKARLCKLIDAITPSGSTNLSGGFLRGCEEVAKNRQSGWINRVLLMTDGLANNGETDPARLNRMAGEWHAKGVTLSTFGMGAEFNEDLLQGMAESGSGQYHFIESPDQVSGIYASELKDLMQTAARQAVLRITPAAGVRIGDVYGYSVRRDGNSTLVALGDLYGGQTRKVVLRLMLDSAQPGSRPVGAFELAFRDVQNDAPQRLSRPLAVEAVEDDARVAASRDLRVLETVESTQAAVTLDSAMRLYQTGKRDEAKRVLINQLSLTTDRNRKELKSQALDTQVQSYRSMLNRFDAPMSDAQSSLAVKRGKVMALEAAR